MARYLSALGVLATDKSTVVQRLDAILCRYIVVVVGAAAARSFIFLSIFNSIRFDCFVHILLSRACKAKTSETRMSE